MAAIPPTPPNPILSSLHLRLCRLTATTPLASYPLSLGSLHFIATGFFGWWESQKAIINKQPKHTDFMSTIEQIEAAILKLPASDYQKLVQWLLDLDYQRWSEQLEQDIIGGKLDTLAQEALADFEAGQYRAI